MKIKATVWLLGRCLPVCSAQDRDNRDTANAAGTGNATLDRQVSGVRLRSTDYPVRNRAATPPIASPAQDMFAGEARQNAGDNALRKPEKKYLPILYNNHAFSVVAPLPGQSDKLKQGAIGLNKLVIHPLDDDAD